MRAAAYQMDTPCVVVSRHSVQNSNPSHLDSREACAIDIYTGSWNKGDDFTCNLLCSASMSFYEVCVAAMPGVPDLISPHR